MSNRLRSLGKALALALLALLAFASGAWGALALWYRLPGGRRVRALGGALWLAGAFALFGWALLRHSAWPLAGYALAYALLLAWWLAVRPSHARDWADDVARLLTGRVRGHTVTLHNVRHFAWRSDADYDARWETATCDLDHLVGVDVVLSHWGRRAIAHAMLSFGFSDGRHLVFSVEIRKRRGQAFSALGGFFKHFETILIAAREDDLIRVRSNVRGEDVQLYPLSIDRAAMRALFLAYVRAANALAARPAFYNTVTANCTTLVHRMARQLRPGLPWDVRLLLTGYLPGYLYDIHVLDHRLPLAAWQARARIGARARACGPDEDFSQAIRRG